MPTTIYQTHRNTTLNPPSDWIKIKTIDMHTGGEPLRVIVDGFPEIEGNTVLEKRRYLKENLDDYRKALMLEPRGHADMYGCLIVPPNDEGADFGIIFIHNEGYSTMCGHATIAITKLAVELGWVEPQEFDTKVIIDAPCGRLNSFAKMKDGEVVSVKFHCVPSFVLALNQNIDVPELGNISFDLAYGGAFYAYVNAKSINLPLTADHYGKHIQIGMAIKKAIQGSALNISHPFENDLSFLYGTIFIDEPLNPKNDSRNICIFADGEVDRSPTGSGVAGRMAIHHKRNEIEIGNKMSIESITNSVFKGSIHETTTYGNYDAVIPQVEGTAFITGQHTFLIDPKDPIKTGFLLR